jgi:hypothetical protein
LAAFSWHGDGVEVRVGHVDHAHARRHQRGDRLPQARPEPVADVRPDGAGALPGDLGQAHRVGAEQDRSGVGAGAGGDRGRGQVDGLRVEDDLPPLRILWLVLRVEAAPGHRAHHLLPVLDRRGVLPEGRGALLLARELERLHARARRQPLAGVLVQVVQVGHERLEAEPVDGDVRIHRGEVLRDTVAPDDGHLHRPVGGDVERRPLVSGPDRLGRLGGVLVGPDVDDVQGDLAGGGQHLHRLTAVREPVAGAQRMIPLDDERQQADDVLDGRPLGQGHRAADHHRLACMLHHAHDVALAPRQFGLARPLTRERHQNPVSHQLTIDSLRFPPAMCGRESSSDRAGWNVNTLRSARAGTRRAAFRIRPRCSTRPRSS